MRPISTRTYILVAVTCLLALPLLAVGLRDVVFGRDPPSAVLLYLWALTVLLSFRPIRIATNVELSVSELAVLAGVMLVPPAQLALLSAFARLVVDLATRKTALRITRNVASQTISAGGAALVFRLILASPADRVIGQVSELILAGALAAFALVMLDVVQILALQLSLGVERLERSAWHWLARTTRAQLLWGFTAVITVEIVLIEPWFLLPAIPIFLLGYLDIRARFTAERRALLLETLVSVSHAVGSSLDPLDVFRSVYRQVEKVMDADNFYVATLADDGMSIRYRFLMDGGKELPPVDRPKAGTLAGVVIDRGTPLLLRDVDHDRKTLGLPELTSWGTVKEHSIIVAPLRQRGTVVGAISAQSRRSSAYDEGDLSLLAAIANEAAIAIERANLHDRTATLSRRMFELHRVGLAISEKTELAELAGLLAESAVELLRPALSAVYLDKGGDALEFAYGSVTPSNELLTLPKSSPLVAGVLESGLPALSLRAEAPEPAKDLLERFGHGAVLLHPLRSAEDTVGLLLVAWKEPRFLTDEERELVGILAGISASTIRSVRLYRELDDAYLSTVSTLMSMIVARDHYREDHQRRVAASAVAIGERMDLSDNDLRDLRYASLFHSLGKIGVPAAILSKTGPLTPDEKKVMQEHPILGARILESIRFLRGVVPIVRNANEHWDGSGYPDALAGEQIPLAARILAVAIAYESMVAERPYRPARRQDQALNEIRGLAGTWYDPTVVNAFASMIDARGAVKAAEADVTTSRELAILAELTPEFHTILDLPQLLDRTLAILERAVPGASLSILLHDESTDELVRRAVAGGWTTIDSPSRMPSDRGISGWVLAHREGQIVEDVRHDPRYVGDPRVRSELVVPLVSRGRALGVLVLSHQATTAFVKRDLTLMETVGAQIAAQIEVADLHERLKRAANTDALTGIHNYRYFYDRLEEEVSRAERRQSALAVAFFDIDALKKVNDTYGHVAGNEVLRTLGQTISHHVRTEDVPARYGGDEFVIVMPDTPPEEAEKVVLRLMQVLDQTPVKLAGGGSIPMPARSWGISCYPADGRTAEALVENADSRAYARKRGR